MSQMNTCVIKTANGDPRMRELILDVGLGEKMPSLSEQKLKVHRPFDLVVAVIGFASDIGTVRNGGRPGGKEASALFRKFMRSKGTILDPETGVDISRVLVLDCGDSFSYDEPEGVHGVYNLEEAHYRHYKRVKEALNENFIVFSIGGSNDQSYPNALALVESSPTKSPFVMNIDAHLDVRPLLQTELTITSRFPLLAEAPLIAHSGSPFYQLQAHSSFSGDQFVEFAAQGSQCSAVHAQHVYDNQGKIVWLSNLRENKEHTSVEVFQQQLPTDRPVFISFDIDAVTGADAPGVSCPASIGLSSQEAIDISRAAGRHKNTQVMDISELCPAVEDYRTPILAAFMFHAFLQGLCERKY